MMRTLAATVICFGLLVGFVMAAKPTTAPVDPATRPTTAPAATLENTYWKLIEVAGKAAVVMDDMPEAQFTLRPGEKRMTGMGSVNRIGGGYTLDGATLKIGPIMSTRMAGPDPLNQQEFAFTAALEQATGYRITGDRLELLDGDRVLARFESRVMQ